MQLEDNSLHDILQENARDTWELMQDPKTHLYIAGLAKTENDTEKVMRQVTSSNVRWRWTRKELRKQNC